MVNPLGLDNLENFGGWCRYGSDNSDWNDAITVIDVLECQQHCIDNTECAAFAYTRWVTINCDLYQGGPYTYGNGKSDTTCYIMKGKPGYFYYSYSI